MPSGHGTGFVGPQREFLNNLVPTFLAKTAYREHAALGMPLFDDDPDLSKWVAARRDEFEAKFCTELVDNQKSSQKIRESFDAFFRNAKSKAKTKWESAAAKEFKKMIVQGLATTKPLPASSSPPPTPASTTPDIPPSDTKLLWSALLKGSVITGRKLFEAEHRSAVSNEIAAVRKRDFIGAKMHAGMMNAKLKTRWDGLTNDERNEWDKKAEDLKVSEKRNLIYRNQALIPYHLSLLLSSLIGPIEDGSHKIGRARFHLLWAFRDCDENLTTGRFDVTGENFGETTSYDYFNPDYATNVMKPWHECCQKTLGRNSRTPSQCALNTIMFDEDCRPLLPDVDIDKTTSEVLRTTLSEFIEAHWVWCRSSIDDNDSIPDRIPWADGFLDRFLASCFQTLQNPAAMRAPLLFELYDRLNAQSDPTFQIFSFSNPTSIVDTPSSSAPFPAMPSDTSHSLSSSTLSEKFAAESNPTPAQDVLPVPAAAPPLPTDAIPIIATRASVPGPSAGAIERLGTAPLEILPSNSSEPTPSNTVPSEIPSPQAATETPSDVTPSNAVPSEIPSPQAVDGASGVNNCDAPTEAPSKMTRSNVVPSEAPSPQAVDGAAAVKHPRPLDAECDTPTEASNEEARPQKRRKTTKNARPPAVAAQRSTRSTTAKEGGANQPPLMAPPVTVPPVPTPTLDPTSAAAIVPTSTDTNTAPIYLNRNGKPRKDSKFWKYVP